MRILKWILDLVGIVLYYVIARFIGMTPFQAFIAFFAVSIYYLVVTWRDAVAFGRERRTLQADLAHANQGCAKLKEELNAERMRVLAAERVTADLKRESSVLSKALDVTQRRTEALQAELQQRDMVIEQLRQLNTSLEGDYRMYLVMTGEKNDTGRV
jgi:septal ring factor EnvC (AmiA/AmiB activator)